MKVGETAADWPAAHERKFYSALQSTVSDGQAPSRVDGRYSGEGEFYSRLQSSVYQQWSGSSSLRLDTPPRILVWHDGQFEILSRCWPGVPGVIPTGKDIVTAAENLYCSLLYKFSQESLRF